jgi:hypothetical protein
VPQECTAGTAIALALEQLQTIDMALDGAVAPKKREPRLDRREILLQALGKGADFYPFLPVQHWTKRYTGEPNTLTCLTSDNAHYME